MKKTYIKNLTYLIFLGILTGLSLIINGCKPTQLSSFDFDTSNYYSRTRTLKENFQTIDSFKTIMSDYNCTTMNYKYIIDSLHQRHNDLCGTLQTYAGKIDDGKRSLFIINPQCVIRNGKITFGTLTKLEKFKQLIYPVDTTLTGLDQDVDDFLRLFKNTCVRGYNTCLKTQQEGSNNGLVEAIEKLSAIILLSDDKIKEQEELLSKQLEKYNKLTGKTGAGEIFTDLLLGLINEIKFILSDRKISTLCNNAHLRYSKLNNLYPSSQFICEFDVLETESEIWGNKILDNSWYRDRATTTYACATHKRGCMNPCASNYDPNSTVDDGSCVGCKDPLAANFCNDKSIGEGQNAPCIYYACTEKCYDNAITRATAHIVFPKFNSDKDQLIHADSLRGNNVCGCTDPCSSNYNKTALIDDGSCNKVQSCGCLDPRAVNYAKRTNPPWAKKLYFNPNITENDDSACIYSGCMSECALNYDPMATSSDGSCICEATTALKIDQKIVALNLTPDSPEFLPKNLQAEFNAHLLASGISNNYGAITFRQIGADLLIDLDFLEIKSKGELDGYPTGVYRFKESSNIVNAMIDFFDKKTSERENLIMFSGTMLTVKIVGEADGKPIRRSGLTFNNSSSISSEPFHLFDPDANTSLLTISNKDFEMPSNSTSPPMLNNNDKFTSNEVLAFLRAYMVKQDLKNAIENKITIPEEDKKEYEEVRIILGAKAHPSSRRGGQYRRVGISMMFGGFYNFIQRTQEGILGEIATLKAAKAYYEKHPNGYPNKSKKYEKCPCLRE